MKVYVVKYKNLLRMFREEVRNTGTQVVYLTDVLTQERIVMSEQFLRSITLKEFEATDEFSPLVEFNREHEKECYNEAVENFSALTDYVWTRTDNLEEVNSALFVIQEAIERIGEDL